MSILQPAQIDNTIENMETAFRWLEASEKDITLPQYRRLKKLRHAFADFLVKSVRADNELPLPLRDK